MKKKKLTGKQKIILLGIVILLAFLAAGAVMNYKIVLNEYFDASEAKCTLPDISRGFIPQGITYDESTDHIFITGYMGNGKVSPIYGINNATGENDCAILMRTNEGDNFRGHAGGMSIYENRLYVAGSTDACMYGFDIQEVLSEGSKANSDDASVSDVETTSNSKKEKVYVNAKNRIELKSANDHIRVSFTSADSELLYAGEFHKDPIFQTDKSHNIKTVDGMQKGLLFGFRLDEEGNAVPVKVYSIPDNIQGACFYEHYIFLSRSHGIFPSEILTYDLDQIACEGDYTFLETEIPLYVLNESKAVKVKKIPPMSEEMVIADGKMYILYESASNRYIIGKWMGLKQLCATPIDYFLE